VNGASITEQYIRSSTCHPANTYDRHKSIESWYDTALCERNKLIAMQKQNNEIRNMFGLSVTAITDDNNHGIDIKSVPTAVSSSAYYPEPSSSAYYPEPSSSAYYPEPSSSAYYPEPSSSAYYPEPSAPPCTSDLESSIPVWTTSSHPPPSYNEAVCAQQ